MHHEIAHQSVVDRLLRGRLPRGVRLSVVRVDADDVEPVEISDVTPSSDSSSPSEDEMQQLLGWFGFRHAVAISG